MKRMNSRFLKLAALFRATAATAALLLCTSFIYAQKARDSVKVFAHRGGKAEFDENTIAAFEASYQKGLRGFETDIRITKDNQLVIFHDGDLKRIFDREGAIEQMTLKELKA